MTTLFYLLTIVFIFFELTRFKKIERIRLALDLISKKKSEDPDAEIDPEDEKNLKTNGCVYVILALLYLMWSFIGLAMSSNWYLFGALFIIMIFTSLIRKILVKIQKSPYNWISRINSSLSILVLIGIFFSHFHPEIFEKFLNLFF